MNNDVDTAAIQIENNTRYSMSTVVNLALADQYLLDKDITFNITEKSSEVYVRSAIKFTCTSGAEVAKDMIKFQDYKLGTNLGYTWQQFGEYYYLCDETGIPKTIERSQAGEIFTFVEKENLLLPRDAIVGKHFTSEDQVTMTIEIEAIQGRNLEDSSIYELNQYFLTEIPSGSYTVKFHETDGTILSEQSNIAYGANAIVPEIEKVKAADHTTFAYWSTTEDGEGLKIRADDEARIFSNISQNMEVWPVYAHDQVRIDVSYNEGGIITPGSTTVDWGTGKTFRVVADSGYSIQQIKRDGVVIYDFSGSKIDMFDYVLENVVADTKIEAIFEPVTYDIIVVTVGNGKVEPGTTTAVFGSSKVFTITPDEGYRIWSISLDGVEVPVTAASGKSQRYTISNINSDHILSIRFVTSVLKITGIAGPNGAVNPNELEVEYGSFASVSVVPNEGYEISAIYVDGKAITDPISKGGVAQNVSFESVTEDHEVRATFTRIQLKITASAGEGGTISPSGEILCDFGSTVSFDIIPSERKTIDKIFVDGSEVAVTVTEGDSQTYVFENIKDSHTIQATFKVSYIRLDINGGSGSQPIVSYSLDGTKFTLSNVEPKGPGGKDFYYYSTRAFDNERGQLGDRYDLGYEYDIPDFEKVTTLYAIYLEPTQDMTVYSTYMVIPKGTTTLKRIGFEEAMQEAIDNAGDNPLGQLIAVLLGIVLSTTQRDANLVYCTLPAGLTTLEWYAFSGCVSLTGVSVPASLSSISMSAFSNTSSFESFTVPYSCISLGSGVFENSGVQQIKMNSKLQSIGADAFKNSGLREFKVQSSITSMGKKDELLSGSSGKEDYTDSVFHDCSKLEKLDFSEQSSFLGQTMQNCISLKEFILPQPLISIPDNAFRNCQSLSYVSYKDGETLVNKFPSTLKKVGQYAFYSCAFTDLLMNDCSKVSIGKYAFSANAFETLKVSTGNISEIESYAFSSSSKLKTVNWEIEHNVPEYCFAYSGNLQTFNSTSIIDGIAEFAFVECSRLSSVNLQFNGADIVIGAGAFKNCAISSMVLPEGISNINSQAFFGNYFKEIVFPSTLAYLADDALQSCYNLEKITLKNDLSSNITNLNKVGAGSTWYVEGEPFPVGTERSSAPNGIGPKNTYTIYPGSASRVDWEWIEVISDTQIKRYTISTDSNGNKTTISTVENKTYAGTEIGKKYITKYIPESIEAGALDIVVPTAVIDLVGVIHDIEGIVSFDTNDIATQKISSGDIVRLELMSGLTYIGADCFNNANSKKLADISVSMTIEYIGVNAFVGTKVSSIKLPSLAFIGESAFANCSNLTSVELSGLITEIPDNCFKNSGLTNFAMPQYLEKIGSSAFAATKLTKLYLSSTIIEIGLSAFADCDKLSTIEGLSNIKITEIKTETFNRCSSLNKVYLPSTLKSIGFWAFNACSSLTNITFGAALESIDGYSFSYCNKLSNLEFPTTLVSIGDGAFVGCSALTKITFKQVSFDDLTVGASAFGGTPSSLEVYIQDVITLDDYKEIFDGTTTDKGFAENATLFYQNAKNPLALYKSKEWKAVRTVIVYCGEGGSATIAFGTDPGVLVQSGQQRTFNIINGTAYTITINPADDVLFTSLFINNISVITAKIKEDKKYSNSVTEDCTITIGFDAQVVVLDENGANGAGWKKHTLYQDDEAGTFTINDDAQNYTKDGKPFYFYSTIKSDNESRQIGKRFDVGVEYSIQTLVRIKVLYAIYLKPTADSNFTMQGGTISLKSGVSVNDLVIPKTINGVAVTAIAERGFSNAAETGQITENTRVSGLITMPSTVESIGNRAFAGNKGINSMFSLPYALKNLGNEVFALCEFTSVNINVLHPNSNVLKFEDNILYTKNGTNKYAYQYALGVTAKEISNIDSTIILPHAFAGSQITKFNDFGKIVSYGDYAFANCSSTQFVVTFTKKASDVSFGTGVFVGTSAMLRIYVPNGEVENYITRFTSQLGFSNGALIYDGEVKIPYAQYSEKAWRRIYKVTTTILSNHGTIIITNQSAQLNNTNTFIAYSDAFGGNIDGYYREDWKLNVVVTSDISNGYKLKTFEIGKKQTNGAFIYESKLQDGKFMDAAGSQFSYDIAAFTRIQDWDIKIDFEIRTQNITIYVDGGVNASSMSLSPTFTGPTSITSGEYNGYKTFKSTIIYNSSFTIVKLMPQSSHIIVSFRYREKVYNSSKDIYEWTDWKYITTENFAKIGEKGYNTLNNYSSDRLLNDIEFVVQTQYSPFILSISGVNEAMGFKYVSDSNRYEKIEDATLVKPNFSTVIIPSCYEDIKQVNSILYYFLQGNKRFDTGISYDKNEFVESNGYYFLVAQFFMPISSDYYSTSEPGTFKLTKQYSGNGAIPKTIGGIQTKTVATNLSSSTQLFLSTSLVLPKTVTTLKEGAFAISKIAGNVYLPTGLINLNEGSLTTKSSATFYQTRLASLSYGFVISADNNYITISTGKTLVTANSQISIGSIPAGITKLGAYVFAGRNDNEYSDKNNDVVLYGKGVFFDTTVNIFTFSKDSKNVKFDGLLLNSTSKSVVYVADDGYMSNLLHVGFMSYEQQTQSLETNPYTSMYKLEGDTSLYAIYRNNVWQRAYFYTIDQNSSKYSFTSLCLEFSDNGRKYVADGLLKYKISIKSPNEHPTAISLIEYLRYDNGDCYAYEEGSLTEAITTKQFPTKSVKSKGSSSKTYDPFILDVSTRIQITTTPTEYTIKVYFQGASNDGIDSLVIPKIDNFTNTFAVEAVADLDDVKKTLTYTISSSHIITFEGVPFGSTVSIKLINNYTNSVFSVYSYRSILENSSRNFDSKTFGFDYAGTRTQSEFNNFKMEGATNIYVGVAVLPIAIDLNGGEGQVPDYTRSSRGSNYYTFNINNEAVLSLKNGDAEVYYFSDDKDKLDFSDTRYDVSNTYVRPLSEIQSFDSIRMTLYARYAKYDTSMWALNNLSCVTYLGTGVSGEFYGSSSSATNLVVVPKEINYTFIKGLQPNALSRIGSDVKYVLLPGGEFVSIGVSERGTSEGAPLPVLGTSNVLTKIQLPSGISSIAVATFRYASSLTDFILHESLESVYSTPNGVLYNVDRTTLYAHPRQKEITSSTILDSTSVIEKYACYDCDLGSAEINLPDITDIGEYAFQNADGIKSVTFGNALNIINQYAFNNCSQLKSAQNIGSVGDSAFRGCSKLESISFNSNCSTIGNSGFRECSLITYFEIKNDRDVVLSQDAFTDCSKLVEISIRAKTINLYASANGMNTYTSFDGTTRLQKMTLIATSANGLNLNVGSFTSGKTVYYYTALSNCGNLYYIQIQNLKQSFEISRFSSITPWYYSSNGVFDYNSTTTYSLSLDGYYTTTSPDFFEWILENIKYDYDNKTIEVQSGSHRIIGFCGTRTAVAVPKILRFRGIKFESSQVIRLTTDGTVLGDSELRSVDFSKISTIGDQNADYSLFGQFNDTLTKLTFGKSVINKNAFKYCVALEETVNERLITKIGNAAFQQTALLGVTLSNVTQIGDWAFADCSRLNDVNLGSSLTKIKGYAFSSCRSLSNLTFNSASCPTIDSTCFNNCFQYYNPSNFSKVKIKIPSYQNYPSYKNVLDKLTFCDKIKNEFDDSCAKMVADDYGNIANNLALYYDGQWRKILHLIHGVYYATLRGTIDINSDNENAKSRLNSDYDNDYYKSVDISSPIFESMIEKWLKFKPGPLGGNMVFRAKTILQGYEYKIKFRSHTAVVDALQIAGRFAICRIKEGEVFVNDYGDNRRYSPNWREIANYDSNAKPVGEKTHTFVAGTKSICAYLITDGFLSDPKFPDNW